MDRKLSEFITVLRHNGLRAAPGEVQDAARAISLLGYADRERFLAALCTTLAKSQSDAEILQRCFAEFFQFQSSYPPAAPAPASTATHTPTAAGPAWLPDALQTLLAATQEGAQARAQGSGGAGSGASGLSVPTSALGVQLLHADSSALNLALAQVLNQIPLSGMQALTQKGLYGRRILMNMGLAQLEAEITALEQLATVPALQRAQQLQQRLQLLRQQVRIHIDRYFQLNRPHNRDALVQYTDFALLQDAEVAQALIQRLAKRLISQHRRREKYAARGLLDVRATLRRNLAHDGVLINPHWRRLRKDRPKVMAICDVSGSVSRYSRFLLLFLYSLQDVIPRLRSFAFSSSLHEVTPLFAELPMADAMQQVQHRYGMGSSDYGRSLVDLEALIRQDIDHKTTLIILGDARNNHGEARLDVLHDLHRRARQVIWLNPEEPRRWGSGDSEMLRYRSACTQTHSCRNLAELERIINRLLRAA